MSDPEPPDIILPTLRCWRWHARQVHPAHLLGEPPGTHRCPGYELALNTGHPEPRGRDSG